MSRGLSISIFTQRIVLRIRTYSLHQLICLQIIEENTGVLRLVSGWVVSHSSIATIGIRPPPDDVGRQKGCKVRIARYSEGLEVNAIGSRLRPIFRVVFLMGWSMFFGMTSR